MQKEYPWATIRKQPDMDEADVIIESFKSSREEIFVRIRHRDNLLKQHLVVQAVLLGLALNVRVLDVDGFVPKHILIILHIPLAFIFMLMYATEHKLIGKLSKHVNDLSRRLNELSLGDKLFFDSSRFYNDYMKEVLPLRTMYLIVAFAMIPPLSTLFLFLEALQDQIEFKEVFLLGGQAFQPYPVAIFLASIANLILVVLICTEIYSCHGHRSQRN